MREVKGGGEKIGGGTERFLVERLPASGSENGEGETGKWKKITKAKTKNPPFGGGRGGLGSGKSKRLLWQGSFT